MQKAWEDGEVDPADVPESAKKPAEEGEEGAEDGEKSPKKKAAPKRVRLPHLLAYLLLMLATLQKKKADDDENGEEEAPKKKRAVRRILPMATKLTPSSTAPQEG